jgi:hypothetical protein
MSTDSEFKPADLTSLKTTRLDERPSLVDIEQFAYLTKPGAKVSQLIDSMPDILGARQFHELVDAINESRGNDRPVVMAIGAHVIKCGLSPLLIDLMERRVITALVTNGACAVHDFEIAACGRTSEDVKVGLVDGSFGTAKETASALSEAAVQGKEKGFGTALGKLILERDLPHMDKSLYAAAVKTGIPITIHVAIGTDVVHMHPVTDGATIGQATYIDFRLLISIISNLQDGVYMNFGSAVLLPEVFLKALSAARNLGARVENFTTADFDMIKHYRPLQNVVSRPGGKGLSFVGHHEIMLPLLRQVIIDRIDSKK